VRFRLALLAVALVSAATAGSVSAGSSTGFFGCRGYTVKHPVAVVRPRSIVVACGDGNFYVTGIRWQVWGHGLAQGSGTAHRNVCVPNCAAGRFRTYAATVTLSGPIRCKGKLVFVTLAYDIPRAGLQGTTGFGC
jgi:hypothetical protein